MSNQLAIGYSEPLTQSSAKGINIPYPTSVELTESVYTQAAATKQRAATRQMAKEDKKMVEEREAARKSLDEINEKLKDVNLDKKEKADLEEEARRLETVINMFDAGG